MKKYELTLKELSKLCRDFQVDCYDGFVSNDESYIKIWINDNLKDVFECECDCLGEYKKDLISVNKNIDIELPKN